MCRGLSLRVSHKRTGLQSQSKDHRAQGLNTSDGVPVSGVELENESTLDPTVSITGEERGVGRCVALRRKDSPDRTDNRPYFGLPQVQGTS